MYTVSTFHKITNVAEMFFQAKQPTKKGKKKKRIPTNKEQAFTDNFQFIDQVSEPLSSTSCLGIYFYIS